MLKFVNRGGWRAPLEAPIWLGARGPDCEVHCVFCCVFFNPTVKVHYYWMQVKCWWRNIGWGKTHFRADVVECLLPLLLLSLPVQFSLLNYLVPLVFTMFTTQPRILIYFERPLEPFFIPGLTHKIFFFSLNGISKSSTLPTLIHLCNHHY